MIYILPRIVGKLSVLNVFMASFFDIFGKMER